MFIVSLCLHIIVGGKGYGYLRTGSQQGQNNIPDSNDFEVYLQGPQLTKGTASIVNSDKHDGKDTLKGRNSGPGKCL